MTPYPASVRAPQFGVSEVGEGGVEGWDGRDAGMDGMADKGSPPEQLQWGGAQFALLVLTLPSRPQLVEPTSGEGEYVWQYMRRLPNGS